MPYDRAGTLALIRTRLAALSPQQLDIVDDSDRHAGHAGAREGGHFTLTIVSSDFAGLSRIERHRLVMIQLGDLNAVGIHALSIDAREAP